MLRVYEGEDWGWKCRYLNTVTGEVRREDPRFCETVLRQQSSEIGKDFRIAASTMRNRGHDVRELQRQPIGNRSDRHAFEIVHTIDAGDGRLGGSEFSPLSLA